MLSVWRSCGWRPCRDLEICIGPFNTRVMAALPHGPGWVLGASHETEALAILADSNPCSRVSKFKLQNQRYRYLLPDEEPLLLAQCTGKRNHLVTMIPFAIATGARKSEQLTLRVRQVDFFRSLIVFDKTKSGRPRGVEMNSEVRQILLNLCRGKQPDDYVWINPATGGPYTDIKHSFPGACSDAKIEGLVWHDLRATYGTRLGEAGFNAYDLAKLRIFLDSTLEGGPCGSSPVLLLNLPVVRNRV